MTPEERKSLAQQITTNPLFASVLDDLEKRAIEMLIYADEPDRLDAQMRVRAIRAFRADLDACLSTRTPKAGPA